MATLIKKIMTPQENSSLYPRAVIGLSLITALASESSCMRRRSQTASSGVTIVGFASNASGAPLAGADVFFEGTNSPVAKTDSTGRFSAAVTEAQVQSITPSVAGLRSHWNIYVRQAGNPALGGISPPIYMGHRGLFDAGVITARPLINLTGKVVKANGNLITPAGGAKLTIGPDQIVTNTDGTFNIPNAIQGKIPAVAELTSFEKTFDTVDTTTATTDQSAITKSEPIVLFNTRAAAAVLIPKPSIAGQELEGSRTTRSFFVKATPAAKYIRYHHQLDDMQKLIPVVPLGASAANAAVNVPKTLSVWREISSAVDYAFPSSGPSSLWFQVANDSGVDRSDLQQATVNVNSCDTFHGIAINGGSAITRSRRNSVSFSGLPTNATRVRLSEDQSSLDNKPWLAISQNIEFMLAAPNSGSNNNGLNSLFGGSNNNSDQSIVASRQIFAEVDTSTGTCPVVSASIQLQPFPENPNMFFINGGGPVSPSKVVMVNIPQIPPNAFEMRLTDLTPNGNQQNNSIGGGSQSPWLRAQPQTTFLFRDAGARLLGLEFRDADGLTSPNYTATVNIIQDQMAGFNLSFAQINPTVPVVPPPPSRYLAMQLIPPQNVVAFRYMEVVTDGSNPNMGPANNNNGNFNCEVQDSSAISSRPWLNIVPFLPVYACGIGLRQFVVQYLAVDGMITTTTNSITIAPVPETLGFFTINNGNPLTLFPTVKLNIAPPVSAIAMSATNLSLQQTTANSSTVFLVGSNGGATGSTSTNDQWLNLTNTLDFKLDSRGVQTIQLRFRDPNGSIFTPSLVGSIFYDPFPHFPTGIQTLTINGGATTTSSPLVTLNIIAPESAFAYRASMDPGFTGVTEWTDIPTNTKTAVPGVSWMSFQFNTPFLISGAAGPKIIYVQFRNELGDRSEAQIATINYQP